MSSEKGNATIITDWVRLRNPQIHLCYSEEGVPGLLIEGINEWEEQQEVRLEIYGGANRLSEILREIKEER